MNTRSIYRQAVTGFAFLLLAVVGAAQDVDWHRSDSNNDGIVNHQDLYNLHNVWQVSGLPLSQTDSAWSIVGDDIYRFDGNVGIGTNDPQANLDVEGAILSSYGLVYLGSDAYGGVADVANVAGYSVATVWTHEDGGGWIKLNDSEGYSRTSLYSDSLGGFVDVINAATKVVGSLWVGTSGNGFLSLYDPEERPRVQLDVNSAGNGELWLDGENGNPNVGLTATGDNSNHGAVTVYDAAGNPRAQMYVDASGNGFVGPVSPKGTISAGMGFDASGRSTLWANQAYLIEDHPTQPDSKIVYSMLEGREPAIFCRGSVTLDHGRTVVELPEDFVALAAPGTLTVQLTPGSLSSKGLAFETLGKGQIEIGELNGGMGSYPVHYLVHAQRAGYENHKAVVSAKEFSQVFAASAAVSAKPVASRRPASTARAMSPRSTLRKQ